MKVVFKTADGLQCVQDLDWLTKIVPCITNALRNPDLSWVESCSNPLNELLSRRYIFEGYSLDGIPVYVEQLAKCMPA